MTGPPSIPVELEEKVRDFIQELLERDSEVAEKLKGGHQQVLLRISDNEFHAVVSLLPPCTMKVLTPRQAEIARLVGLGLGNNGIAKRLKISEHTVAGHIHDIFATWDIHSRAQLARYALLLLDSTETE